MRSALLLSLLASTAIFAAPNSIDQFESRSSDRSSCRDKLRKGNWQKFCKADLAFYKTNKCTFPKRIPWLPLPTSVTQFAQQTVLEACSDLLGVPVPTCAPVVPPLSSACFSSSVQTIPGDPSTLGICKSCTCRYIPGVFPDGKLGTSITSDPLAIQCLYEFTGAVDTFQFPSFVGSTARSRAIYNAYGAQGGHSGTDDSSYYGTGVLASRRGLCTADGACSIFVGQRGADAPSDPTVPISSSYGGGGATAGGGAGGGGASYLSTAASAAAVTRDSILMLAAGRGGDGVNGAGRDYTRNANRGTFLQGGEGTNGGGGGGSGYTGGDGGSQAVYSGWEGDSDYAQAGSLQSPPSSTGHGRIFITFGCADVCDGGCGQNR